MRCQTQDDPSSSPDWCKSRLDVLRPYITENSVGAELGVFKGSFLDYLFSQKPEKIYAVDPWYRFTPEWPWAGGDKSTVNALIRILVEFRPEVERGKLIPVVDFSQSFLRTVEDNYLDWIYIDTSHKFQQTLMELALSVKKVKTGGFIMGDDYIINPKSPHHGVYRAVQEFVGSGEVKMIIAGENNQFVLTPVK